jgi:hypothetical protein
MFEFFWWGWQSRNITFTKDLDVDVKAVRQLLDEDNSIDPEEVPQC